MNTEALKILRERRSIRKYKNQQVSDEDLNAVLEAGTYAPTAKNKQAATIVAVQNAEDLAVIRKLNAQVWGKDIDPYYGSPTILLVLADPEVPTYVEDGSAVITYLLVAAHAVGLGACWINREREMFETAEGKALLKKWGLSENLVGVAGCSLGYIEGENPKPYPRKEKYIIHVK
ncbi:MAG: hypothetical protein DELT_01927 [Desulfovibrio sp.]